MSSSERASLINSPSAEELGPKRDIREDLEKIFRPLIAEFVATCLFVFIGCMSAANGGGTISVAIAHGFVIALMVTATGKISGGHLNPAVTLGVLLAGGIRVYLALAYVLAQLLGAVTGAALVRAALPLDDYINMTGGAQTLDPSANGVDPGPAILMELLLTSVLVLSVLLTAVDSDTKSDLAPLAIGFAVTAGVLAGSSFSGASLNPARTFGPALAVSVYKSSVWTYHYVYWIGPLLGASVAGLLYRLVFACPEKRLWRQFRQHVSN